MKYELIKRENAGELVLTMMIWAVVSLLGTRLWLQITGYPQIGRGSWHVAHALLGGLVMVGGMLMAIALNGDRVRKNAAAVFGLGLGLFVDEMGKYMSRDNNYFFQPAIIFMYIFFVSLFLIYRYLERITPQDPKTLLYQVLDNIEEIAEGDFEQREKKDILKKLDVVALSGSEEMAGFAKKLKPIIEEIEPKEDRTPSTTTRLWQEAKTVGYRKVFTKKPVLYLLTVLAVAYTLSGVVDTVGLALSFRHHELEKLVYEGVDLSTRSDLSMFVLKTGIELVTSILFAVGVWLVVKKKTKSGIAFFQYGLLVNIFILSLFRFYFEQFSAVFTLLFTVVIYTGLKRMGREIG